MLHHPLGRALALAFFCFVPPAMAQDAALLGAWVGIGEENEGQTVTVERDAFVLGGQRVPMRFDGPGVLLVGPAGEQERVTYQIAGDELTVRDSESTTKWRRVKPAPAPKPGNQVGDQPNPQPANPLGAKPAVNPLAARPVADPFVRRFSGDGVDLLLTGSAAQGYSGTLTFRGTPHKAQARAQGSTLLGSFEVEASSFDFTARLDGDQMTLSSGGSDYRMVGEPQAPAAPRNPLAGGNPAPTPVPPSGPAPGTTRLVNNTADIACDLPDGWSVINESNEGCLINPGFKQGQTLDVTLSLHCLPVEAKYRGVAIDQFLVSELPQTRQSLLTSGIRTNDPEQAPRVFSVGGGRAASSTMRATTAEQRNGVVWIAVRIEGDKCLACSAIFLNGQEATFLPQVEQVFATLRQASAAGRAPAPVPEPTPVRTDKQDTLVLEKRELRDPQMNNEVSHVILVPKGWTFTGGVRWTQHVDNYLHFVARMQAPDGAELSFDYDRSFSYASSTHAPSAGQRMGGTDESGNTLLSPPTKPGDAAVRAILPHLRPSATDVRLVDAKTIPEAEQQLRAALAPLLDALAQGPTVEGMGGGPWLHVEEARVAYTEGGREWEEMVFYSMVGGTIVVRTEYMSADSGNWAVRGVRTVRAPRGQLDASLKTMLALAGTVRETARWSTMVHELRMRLQQIRHEGNMAVLREMGKRSQIAAQTSSQLSDMQMASWRKQQESSDRMHRATVNSIVGVEDYRTTDGNAIALDNRFDRVFQDGIGNVILTNDVSYDPNADRNLTGDWAQLQRLR